MIDDSQNKIQKIISSFSFFSNYFVKSFLHSNRNKAKVFEINNYDIDFIMNMANLKMSGFSQYIMENLEIEKLVVKRRKNYYNFVEGLRGLPQIVPVYPCLPQEVGPWVLPVIFTGKQNFHIVLRERGIPAFTWSAVIHPKLSVEDFQDSAFLYHNLVLLPVHQSLTESEIQTMIQIIAQALNSWT